MTNQILISDSGIFQTRKKLSIIILQPKQYFKDMNLIHDLNQKQTDYRLKTTLYELSDIFTHFIRFFLQIKSYIPKK